MGFRGGPRVLCALVLALTACSADGSAPSADGSATSSPEPAGAREIEGEGAPLAAGLYTFSPFEPHVTFRLAEGFEGGHTNVEFFDVFHGDAAALAFAAPDYVSGRGGERLEVPTLSPSEALRALRDRKAFEAVKTVRMTVGSEDVAALEGTGRASGTEIFGGPGGALGIQKGDRYRIAALKVEGRLVLVMQQALEPPHARAFAATDPVLPTISFGPE